MNSRRLSFGVSCNAGNPGIAFIYPTMQLPIGARMALQPDNTKTGARDGPMSVEIRRDIICSMSWLGRLLQASEATKLLVTNYITRPQSRDKAGFLERCLTSAEVANRVRKHFMAAGLYLGQTVHGSRRGSMQHDVYKLGKSAEEAGQAAQIRTPAIVQRYLDPFRHCK